jgi:hypothetical protein
LLQLKNLFNSSYQALSADFSKAKHRFNLTSVEHLKIELSHLNRVFEKTNTILKKFEKKINNLYQYAEMELTATIILIISPYEIDSSSPEYLTFANNVLKIHTMPKDAVFLLGAYSDIMCLLNQFYPVTIAPLTKIREFRLEANDYAILSDNARKKQERIRSEFNAEYQLAMSGLESLAMEEVFAIKKNTVTFENHNIQADKLDLVLRDAKTDVDRSDHENLNLLKDCTIITRNFRVCDLPQLNSTTLTLINDNELLLVMAEISHKITQTFNNLLQLRQYFHSSPSHLLKVTKQITKASLIQMGQALVAKFEDLENALNYFLKNDEKEPISFAQDPKLITFIQDLNIFIRTDFMLLQADIINSSDDNAELIAELHQKILQVECKFDNLRIKFNNFNYEYKSNIILAKGLAAEHANFQADFEKKTSLVNQLKEKLAALRVERKWLEHLSLPLDAIAIKIKVLDQTLGSMENFYKSCPTPINCINLRRQKVIIDCMRAAKIKFETEVVKAQNLIIVEEQLIQNADIAKQKKYAEASNAYTPRFDFASGATNQSTITSSQEINNSPRPS